MPMNSVEVVVILKVLCYVRSLIQLISLYYVNRTMTSNSCKFKMSKLATTCISFLTVLAISQISFAESHQEHPTFKQLGRY